MIDDRRVLAVIPARGGSQGLPGKNLAPLRGRPLLHWTVHAALESAYIDRVIVSSDDAEILESARSAGAETPFVRPGALSGDEARSVDAVLHALDQLDACDLVVLLQPTSPLRTAADIDAALRIMLERGASSCVSVCEADCHPYLVFAPDDGGRLAPYATRPALIERRQDFPPAYQLNGAVYAARTDWLKREQTFVRSGETVFHLMPAERSIDIDTREDLAAAEAMATRLGRD